MNAEVPNEVRAATTKCPNDFTCLSAGRCGDHDLCDVEYPDGKSVLFLVSRLRPNCPYAMPFGDKVVCTCPTHFAIHQRHG